MNERSVLKLGRRQQVEQVVSMTLLSAKNDAKSLGGDAKLLSQASGSWSEQQHGRTVAEKVS